MTSRKKIKLIRVEIIRPNNTKRRLNVESADIIYENMALIHGGNHIMVKVSMEGEGKDDIIFLEKIYKERGLILVIVIRSKGSTFKLKGKATLADFSYKDKGNKINVWEAHFIYEQDAHTLWVNANKREEKIEGEKVIFT